MEGGEVGGLLSGIPLCTGSEVTLLPPSTRAKYTSSERLKKLFTFSRNLGRD